MILIPRNIPSIRTILAQAAGNAEDGRLVDMRAAEEALHKPLPRPEAAAPKLLTASSPEA